MTTAMELAFKQAEQRKERNKEITDAVKSGEYLQSFNKEASWYPQRPVIKKDQSAIRKIYGEDSSK